MAERSGPDTFLEGAKYGLEKVGKANITLKPKQEEILKIIALTQKDVLAVLPTGYGKSLIYQIMPPLMDYMDSGQRPTQNKSIQYCLGGVTAQCLDKGSGNKVKAEWSESRRCAHYDCDALWIQNFQDGGEGREISQVICFIFQ